MLAVNMRSALPSSGQEVLKSGRRKPPRWAVSLGHGWAGRQSDNGTRL